MVSSKPNGILVAFIVKVVIVFNGQLLGYYVINLVQTLPALHPRLLDLTMGPFSKEH
jgi:hypothetical protein